MLKQGQRRTVIVATDVAARGLDIAAVGTVVHYDAARTMDAFVHRSGRTAVRAKKIAIVLLILAMMKTRKFGLESLKIHVERLLLAV